MALRPRLAIVSVIIAIVPIAASAQLEPRYGIQAGVNFSRLSFDFFGADIRSKGSLGFQVGAVARIGDGRWAFMPGAILTQQGGKWEYSDIDFEGSYLATEEFTLTYLKLPLLAVFRPRAEDFPGERAPFFFAGPAVAQRVGCSRKFSIFFDGERFDDESDSGCSEQDLAKTVTSLIVGGGIEFGAVSIAIQYDHGLTNLDAGSGRDSIKNRTFSIVGRYLFGIQ